MLQMPIVNLSRADRLYFLSAASESGVYPCSPATGGEYWEDLTLRARECSLCGSGRVACVIVRHGGLSGDFGRVVRITPPRSSGTSTDVRWCFGLYFAFTLSGMDPIAFMGGLTDIGACEAMPDCTTNQCSQRESIACRVPLTSHAWNALPGCATCRGALSPAPF